jgi:phenylpyruvate tautomerase PptA (4-oxalocrotonate tautomerase family)
VPIGTNTAATGGGEPLKNGKASVASRDSCRRISNVILGTENLIQFANIGLKARSQSYDWETLSGKIRRICESIRKESTMPLIQLDTSCSLSDPDMKQALAKKLSQIAAEASGKPEQYVMASIHDNVTMTMSGAADPCALVTVKAIGGLSKAVNQTFASKISQVLQKELGIPPNRSISLLKNLIPPIGLGTAKPSGKELSPGYPALGPAV